MRRKGSIGPSYTFDDDEDNVFGQPQEQLLVGDATNGSNDVNNVNNNRSNNASSPQQQQHKDDLAIASQKQRRKSPIWVSFSAFQLNQTQSPQQHSFQPNEACNPPLFNTYVDFNGCNSTC